MGGVLDECRLRLEQIWRRPLKIPPILEVQRIFSKYYRKRTPTEKEPLVERGRRGWLRLRRLGIGAEYSG